MFIKDLKNCEEIVAGDNTKLRVILHPDKEDLEIRYSLAHARLGPGKTSQPHSLKTTEIYYILEGEGQMHIDDECVNVFPEQTIYIPPMAKQHIKNIGNQDLKFICIVDPAWRPEDEIIY
ncbi:MAG: cupin domain-containing protein [Bacteroidales bacterium]|nr:cupin domain-containing protein [Bacteroidales bacterium]